MFAGTKILRPAETVSVAAAPPATSVDIAETEIESRSGPKITSELIANHPTEPAISQPVARPHHSRSESSVQRLEIPAKAMRNGTPRQVYSSIFATGCENSSVAPNQRVTPPSAPDTITATNSKKRKPWAGSSDPNHEHKWRTIPRYRKGTQVYARPNPKSGHAGSSRP